MNEVFKRIIYADSYALDGVQAGVFVLIKENDNSSYADDLVELFGNIKNGWGFSRAFWSYQPSPSEFVKHIQILGIILFFHHTFDSNVYLFEDTDVALLLENGFPEMSFFLTNESRDFVIYVDSKINFSSPRETCQRAYLQVRRHKIRISKKTGGMAVDP